MARRRSKFRSVFAPRRDQETRRFEGYHDDLVQPSRTAAYEDIGEEAETADFVEWEESPFGSEGQFEARRVTAEEWPLEPAGQEADPTDWDEEEITGDAEGDYASQPSFTGSYSDLDEREARILSAMAKATYAEQTKLMADLNDIRQVRAARIAQDRELDLANAVIRDTMTPVPVHGRVTSSTDWLDEVSVYTDTDTDITVMAAEWVGRVDDDVKESLGEFITQAKAMARRTVAGAGAKAEADFVKAAAKIAYDEDWDEEDFDEIGEVDSSCPMCGGQGTQLGSLGANLWLRCRNCGWDWPAKTYEGSRKTASYIGDLEEALGRNYGGSYVLKDYADWLWEVMEENFVDPDVAVQAAVEGVWDWLVQDMTTEEAAYWLAAVEPSEMTNIISHVQSASSGPGFDAAGDPSHPSRFSSRKTAEEVPDNPSPSEDPEVFDTFQPFVAPENADAYDQKDGVEQPLPGAGESTATRKTAARPIHHIYDEIVRDWKNPNYAAVPYLDAMRYLGDMSDSFYSDSAPMVVGYFLSNAGSWRGETARRVKAELRAMIDEHYGKTSSKTSTVRVEVGTRVRSQDLPDGGTKTGVVVASYEVDGTPFIDVEWDDGTFTDLETPSDVTVEARRKTSTERPGDDSGTQETSAEDWGEDEITAEDVSQTPSGYSEAPSYTGRRRQSAAESEADQEQSGEGVGEAPTVEVADAPEVWPGEDEAFDMIDAPGMVSDQALEPNQARRRRGGRRPFARRRTGGSNPDISIEKMLPVSEPGMVQWKAWVNKRSGTQDAWTAIGVFPSHQEAQEAAERESENWLRNWTGKRRVAIGNEGMTDIPNRSEYEHWNEEADQVWYQENKYDMMYDGEPGSEPWDDPEWDPYEARRKGSRRRPFVRSSRRRHASDDPYADYEERLKEWEEGLAEFEDEFEAWSYNYGPPPRHPDAPGPGDIVAGAPYVGRRRKQAAGKTASDVTPRIYVASLSDYNNGILHGVWIDATQGVDYIWAEVQKMLASSPAAKKYGDVAEEWAIHDYEGFGNLRLSEWESFDRVAEIAAAIEAHGDAYAAFADMEGIEYAGVDRFEEMFAGEWDSEEDYAQNFLEDVGDPRVDDPYFDIGSYSRDVFINDMYSVPAGGGGVYVFRLGSKARRHAATDETADAEQSGEGTGEAEDVSVEDAPEEWPGEDEEFTEEESGMVSSEARLRNFRNRVHAGLGR